MPSAPGEFPPPFDPTDYVGPADRPRGRAPRGRYRDRRRWARRARMREQGHAAARGRAGADREARRDPGGSAREGQGLRRTQRLRRQHAAVGDGGALPGPRSRGLARLPEGREGRRLSPDQEAGDSAEAAAAELPQPRQLRDFGREAVRASSPRRRRRRAPTSSPRPRPTSSWSRTGSSGACAPATRAATATARARQLRARLRPDGEGDRARRGHDRPPDRRRGRLLRPRPATRSAGRSASRRSGRSRSHSIASSTR